MVEARIRKKHSFIFKFWLAIVMEGNGVRWKTEKEVSFQEERDGQVH